MLRTTRPKTAIRRATDKGYGVNLATGGRADHWIKGAIRHPGALHRDLGVPAGEKIPKAKLEKAAHSSNPKLAERAHLAETLGGLKKG